MKSLSPYLAIRKSTPTFEICSSAPFSSSSHRLFLPSFGSSYSQICTRPWLAARSANGERTREYYQYGWSPNRPLNTIQALSDEFRKRQSLVKELRCAHMCRLFILSFLYPQDGSQLKPLDSFVKAISSERKSENSKISLLADIKQGSLCRYSNEAGNLGACYC